jgi:hypothetical protein
MKPNRLMDEAGSFYAVFVKGVVSLVRNAIRETGWDLP